MWHKAGDNGNAVFQRIISKQTKKKQLKILSYRRYGEHGKEIIVLSGIICSRCCTRRNLRFYVEICQHADQKQLTRP